jgi:hypothetical protein
MRHIVGLRSARRNLDTMRILSLVLAILIGGLGAVQALPAPRTIDTPLDQARTEAIVRAFDGAEHWALQAIVLYSLGTDFHPSGAAIVLKALQSKEERLRPYAIELLLHMRPEALAKVASAELVDELIEKCLHEKNARFTQRTLDVLGRLFPQEDARDRAAWTLWWSTARKTYAVQPWVAPPASNSSDKEKTVSGGFVERAFDLRDAGLDVAIVIDSTGSMQKTIDAARDAIGEVVALLSGVAPKLRLGLVHYKDLEDLGDGAQLLVPMTKDQKEVRERLAKLQASGGGDPPERVEKGVEVALSKDMNWNKEANRLILVIGDAPPHPESIEPLLALVKRAHDDPFPRGKGPTTGPTKPNPYRPFITSTIAIGRDARDAFAKIAEAGGGTSVVLDVAGARNGGDGDAVRRVIERIMLLSFGAQYSAQLEDFVQTYFEYHDAGMF